MTITNLDPLALAGYGALLFISYLFYLAFSRAFCHPLSKYPGPRLAVISDIYGAWGAYRFRLYQQTYDDHAKYGPVFRAGPNKLVFNSLKAMQDIYQSDNFSKSHLYTAANVNPSSSNVFNTLDKPLHREKRRRILPIISERSMRTFEPKMMEQINIFRSNIWATYQKNPQEPIDMSPRMRYLGMDTVAQLAFGYDLNMQKEDKNRFVLDSLYFGGSRLFVYMQWPKLRKFKAEYFSFALSVLRGKSLLMLIRKMISARVAQGEDSKHDLYSFMVKSLGKDMPEKERNQEMWTEAIFFLPAGGDTSATTMASTLHYLAKNKACRARLAEEIRSTFASNEDICAGAKLSGCQYLRACIDEALRLSPPVASPLWREVSPECKGSPSTVDGHVIPPGTQVGVSAYCLHRNPELFPEPDVYKPERWLPETDGKLANKAAFIAFSAGSRACGGKAMAYQEVSLTIAKTLWDFDFDFAQGMEPASDDFVTEDVFTANHEGPYLRLVARDGAKPPA